MKSLFDPEEIPEPLPSNKIVSLFDTPQTSPLAVPISVPELNLTPEPDFSSDDFRDIGDIEAERRQIFARALEAAQNLQPVSNTRYTLALTNPHYIGKERISKADHKKALMTNSYLTRKLAGTWELRDKEGNVVGRKNAVIAHIPYLTDIGTFARNGNDYTLSHQFRLRPGVYTRWQDNGELEAHINVSGGIGHKIYMDPETGIFKMRFGQASLPAVDVLKILGVTDQQMQDCWGDDIYYANIQKTDPKALNKLYQKFTYGKGKAETAEEKKEVIKNTFAKMGLDPRVSKATLGKPYDTVTPDVIMDTTAKLIRVNKGLEETDSRDNMAFQKLYGPEDIISDKIAGSANTLRQALWKLSANGNLDKIPTGLLDKSVDSAIIGSGLGMPLEEVNALELFDNQFRVTRLGEGGISSIDAIPDSARNVHPSQMGFTDILRTPESLKAGVDSRMSTFVKKGKDGTIYTKVRDLYGNDHWRSAQDIADAVVAFPNELRSSRKFVAAIVNGKMRMVPRDKVEYEFPAMQNAQHAIGQMVPMTSGVKAQRAVMAARMLTQALPLENPEAPFVQAGIPDELDKSYEEKYGEKFGAVRAHEPLKITKVTDDSITAVNLNGEEKTFDLYRNMAFNRKTGIDQTPMVQPGDIVKEGGLLAKSNFTDDNGTAAVGKNTKIAYLPYKGLTFEDGFVVSESYAKRMASIHYYKNKLPIDKNTHLGTSQFVAAKPGVYSKEQLANFTEDGVIKPGTVVHTGDPLLLAVNKIEPTEAQRKMGRKVSWKDASVTWEHHDDGVVTDVFHDAKGAQVVVKTKQQLREADKLSGRYGNKAVVARIVPDEEMPTLEDGTKPELLLSTLSLVSRVNPAQIAECILGKVAAKTGKRYAIKDFQDEEDLIQFAKDEAAKYGIKDTETLTDEEDPDHPKKIPGVLVGNMFIMKLHHSAESKAQGRGIGRYTMDGKPAKGGDDGAKRVGMLELSALLSHGATKNIADLKYVKGQENLDYWRQYLAGYNPPTPRIPYVYDKFVNYLKGSGINVQRENGRIHLMALTNSAVDDLVGDREITGVTDPRTGLKTLTTVAWDDNLKALPGGLFDPDVTGGHAGNQWSYFKLNLKLPNPVMETPLRLMLKMTENEFRDVMAGKKTIETGTGPEALYAAASKLNIKNELERARDDIKSGKKTYRDAAVKRLGYLKSAEQLGQEPKDWFLDKCPVIPPFFRPVSVMGGNGLPLVADANYLYKELFDINQTYGANKKMFGEENSRDLGLAMYDAFKAVTGLGDPNKRELKQKNVDGFLKHVFGSGAKYSMIQTKLLGTPTDLSGRAVISLNPDYDMDTIGLPESVAWDTYKPLVIRKLRQSGRNGMVALKEVENHTEAARRALQEVMESRPVLLNRAPTLHKFGIMALMPKLIKGDTIKINPFICGGAGADFDGDNAIGSVFIRILSTKKTGSEQTFEKNIDNFLTQDRRQFTISLINQFSLPINEDKTMKENCALNVKSAEKFEIVDLENFPRLEKINESEGQFGQIDWFAVPENVEVLAYNEETGNVGWMHPTVFSIHHGCPVVIATTNNKRQIYTDDDPRAIYGLDPNTFKFVRATPKDALEKHIMIPRMRYADNLIPEVTMESIQVEEFNPDDGRAHAIKDALPVDEKLGYIFGAVIGDGWYSGNQLYLSDKDFDVADRLDECIASTTIDGEKIHSGLHDGTYNAMGESWRHAWSYTQLGKFITKHIGHGCRNKHLPVWFLNTPESFRKGLFAGLMDTDGGIGISNSKKKPQLLANYTTTCLRLAREIVMLAATLNISASITTNKTPAGLPCWYVVFSAPDIKRWGGEYMAMTNKVEKIKNTEVMQDSPAAARTNLVPVGMDLANKLCQIIGNKKKPTTEEDVERKKLYAVFAISKKSGNISRPTAKKVIETLTKYNLTVDHPDFENWKTIVYNEEIVWEYIAEVEDTKIVETGYDLTVPGSDTFVNSEGIVLSNTMVFHVPTTAEAAQEALDRMLPSKNLLSPSDFSVVPGISRDNEIGLYESTRPNPEKATRVYATTKDVVAAWKRGELNPRDKVRVLSDD